MKVLNVQQGRSGNDLQVLVQHTTIVNVRICGTSRAPPAGTCIRTELARIVQRVDMSNLQL